MKLANNMWYVIDTFNKYKLTRKIYVFFKGHIKKGDFKIEQLCKPEPIKDERNKNRRYTIILPSIRKSKVFGGVKTALDFFYGLLEKNPSSDGRIIIICNEKFDKNFTINMGEYSEKNVHRQIVYMANTNRIDIRENEIFIFTTWGSAYSFIPIFRWQKKEFNITQNRAVYLIQDYEPGFAAWSSWFALAESTYRMESNSIIAVFNSEELYNYFKFNGYSFENEIVFKPKLNEVLKRILYEDNRNKRRNKKIIIYGRPNEPRNAYEIIRYSLKLWSEKYPNAKEWEIISMGAPSDNIELSNNVIISLGKVSLEEYASEMLTAYAGISLMISPHPSYPPLEMSTFGVKTITNRFMNKNLDGFNKNIISVKNCTPEAICKELTRICDLYGTVESEIDLNEGYLNGIDFEMAINKTYKYLNC